MDEVMLEVKNVSKSFRLRESRADSLKGSIARLFSPKPKAGEDFEALKNISFDLLRGEALGIIGKNGAGKSTLLRILSGINIPDSGEINFYGKAVSILDIGAGFHPELTGRENVYLSAALYKFTREKTEEKFDDIVAFSGIGKFIDEPVKNYSSGMYLRLAFGIITCLDADIYLIDEVINVGDASFQMKCKDRIEELMAAGKTLLIASHNMNEISILCNRVIFMEHGQIVEIGTPDIIQKYMAHSMPQYFDFQNGQFFHIRDLSESPFWQKNITISDYGIKNYKLNPEGLSTSHPFTVFLNFEMPKSKADVEVKLKFYDATGALIFTCTSKQKGTATINSAGNYSVEFNIPANLLNARLYYVELRMGDNMERNIMFKADKFITLKMADDSNQGGPVRNALAGLIKPFVQASVTKMDA